VGRNGPHISRLRATWTFLWARKRLWLGPIVVMVIIVALLFTISIGVRIAPTIYSLF
jgi:Family of unknown function (DUF5989)